MNSRVSQARSLFLPDKQRCARTRALVVKQLLTASFAAAVGEG